MSAGFSSFYRNNTRIASSVSNQMFTKLLKTYSPQRKRGWSVDGVRVSRSFFHVCPKDPGIFSRTNMDIQNYGLEKVTPLTMAIFGIYVKGAYVLRIRDFPNPIIL